MRNTHVQAPIPKKYYTICGPEFGLKCEGKKALISRTLYGDKFAVHDFWYHLRSCKNFLGFESCPADPEVWIRIVKCIHGIGYYKYFLLHTNDCFVVSNNAETIL